MGSNASKQATEKVEKRSRKSSKQSKAPSTDANNNTVHVDVAEQPQQPTVSPAEPLPVPEPEEVQPEPRKEEPVPEEPAQKVEPVHEEPAQKEEPIPEESAQKVEPVPEEPAQKEESVHEEQAQKEEPVPEEPAQKEEPVPEEPAQTEEPVPEEPAQTEELVPEESAQTEESISEELVHEEPVHEEPVHEEPVHEEPVHEEPVHEEPVPEEPVYEEPVKEESVPEEPTHEDPVQEQAEDFVDGAICTKEEVYDTPASSESSEQKISEQYPDQEIVEEEEEIGGEAECCFQPVVIQEDTEPKEMFAPITNELIETTEDLLHDQTQLEEILEEPPVELRNSLVTEVDLPPRESTASLTNGAGEEILPSPPVMKDENGKEEFHDLMTNGHANNNNNVEHMNGSNGYQHGFYENLHDEAAQMIADVTDGAQKRLHLVNLVKKHLVSRFSVDTDDRAEELAEQLLENVHSENCTGAVKMGIDNMCAQIGWNQEDEASHDLANLIEAQIKDIFMKA